jgi:transposase
VLQDAGIKIDSVASSIAAKSGRAMIEALIDGERRGAVLADLAKGNDAALSRRPGPPGDDPGAGTAAAAAVISEMGADVRQFFSDAAHLASWAGLCPGNHESAGKRHFGKRRPGNRHLQPVLAECAWAAVRHDGYLKALYHRHVMKWGGYRSPLAKNKAVIVVAHALLVIIWQVLATGKPYGDLGSDYFTGLGLGVWVHEPLEVSGRRQGVLTRLTLCDWRWRTFGS